MSLKKLGIGRNYRKTYFKVILDARIDDQEKIGKSFFENVVEPNLTIRPRFCI